MNATVVQSVLGSVIVAAILWLASSVRKYGETLAVVKTALVGINGDNGINSDVKALRKRSHEHGDAIHALNGKHALLEQRVDTLEQAG